MKLSSSLAIILVVGLSSCARYSWAPGPDARGTYEEAAGRCQLMASADRTAVYAQGTPSYVAGAAVGVAVGDAVRQQRDFNNCMMASGWVATGKANPEAQAAVKTQAMAIFADAKACIHAVRTNPKYLLIAQHLKNETTNRYSLIQMSDSHLATLSEATLLSAYAEDQDKCIDAHMDQIAQMDPRAATKIREVRAAMTDLDLALVERKLTWGDYSRAAQAVSEAAQTGKPLPPSPIGSPKVVDTIPR